MRFMARFEASRAFKEKLRSESPALSHKQLREAWVGSAGPDVTRGPEANWIPAVSLVVVDETQHWLPNPALKQVIKIEPPTLMSYLTMHRHLMHWVWFTTQRERQISTTIKSLVNRVWQVRQRGYDKLAWGIQFRHIGISALGYRAFRPEDNIEQDPPHEEFTTFPWLPWNQVYFRLYDSFTHAGSRRELKAGLRAARLEAGLDESGRLESEVDMATKKRGCIGRLFVGAFKLGMQGVMLLVVLSIGMAWGEHRNKAAEAADEKGRKAVVASQPVVMADGVRVVGMSPKAVRLSDGSAVNIGGRFHEFMLSAIESGKGVSVWSGRGDVWVWKVGGARERLGSIPDVVHSAEKIRNRSADESSGGATSHPATGAEIQRQLGDGGAAEGVGERPG